MKLESNLSPNSDDRSKGKKINFLVVHYTAAPLGSSLATFTNPTTKVSAHYLIPYAPEPITDTHSSKQYCVEPGDTLSGIARKHGVSLQQLLANNHIPNPDRIFPGQLINLDPRTNSTTQGFTVRRLVNDAQRAWHAGTSSWTGETALNDTSIGIEIVNPGFIDSETMKKEDASKREKSYGAPLTSHKDSQGKQWFHFPKEQIAALIELANPLVKQYKIEPTCVVGHADIAPGRKQDPGPLFPWYTLADQGIGAWPRADVVKYYEKRLKETQLSTEQIQKALNCYGYDIMVDGKQGPKTKNTMASFQMHFSPTDYLGKLEDASKAVLCALVEEYFPNARDTILGAQIPSSGVKGPAINSQQFLQSIASYQGDETAQHGAATSWKDQLFKPAGLSQLLNLS